MKYLNPVTILTTGLVVGEVGALAYQPLIQRNAYEQGVELFERDYIEDDFFAKRDAEPEAEPYESAEIVSTSSTLTKRNECPPGQVLMYTFAGACMGCFFMSVGLAMGYYVGSTSGHNSGSLNIGNTQKQDQSNENDYHGAEIGNNDKGGSSKKGGKKGGSSKKGGKKGRKVKRSVKITVDDIPMLYRRYYGGSDEAYDFDY